ncbi:MAG: 3-hydroxybutyrate dehydrogenase [Myxococcota bacterium]|jgi:3-hydroxybutyrate dehydrogenase
MKDTVKIALVTGGSRGIGRAIAIDLAGRGYRVVVTGRTVDQLEAVAAETGGVAIEMDVADRDATDKALERIFEEVGAPSILVNNAGISYAAPIGRARDDRWDRTFEINVTSAFRITRAVVPKMVEAGWGRIINLASNAGLSGYQYTHAYCASKHAMVGLTRSLAHELARTGITVNAVCPGWVQTDMFDKAIERITRSTGRSTDEARASLVNMSPARRAVTVEEVAHAVSMLCDPNASAINGQSIPVDGGQLMK